MVTLYEWNPKVMIETPDVDAPAQHSGGAVTCCRRSIQTIQQNQKSCRAQARADFCAFMLES
jgi:hypothetical protein